MDLQAIFDNLVILADASNGVAKLRELIMQLAVRGKLASQDPNDEPATSLLKSIFQEKRHLATSKTAKGIKPSKPIQDDEVPYSLPSTWVWQRVEELFYPISPSQNKVKSSEVNESGRFPVVDQGKNFIAGYVDDESKLIRIPGPVIIFGDHTCELKLVNFDFVAGADGVKILRPIHVYEPYFYRVLQTFEVAERGYSRHYKFFLDNLFPLAPLAEQKRIVAKIDELMRLCDELEERQQASRESRVRLNNATLAPLNNAASREPDEFGPASARLADNFDTLYDSAETVGRLRSTVLQLAVQGKLVPQDPHDEPASVLLDVVIAERAGKSGANRNNGETPEDKKIEAPFIVASNWLWTTVGTIANKITDGEHISPKKTSEGMFLLTAKHIRDHGVTFDEPQYVSFEDAKGFRSRCDPERGDVLVCSRGTIGRCAVVKTDQLFCLMGSVILIKPNKNIESDYLKFFLDTEWAQKLMRGMSGATAVNALYLKDIRRCPFPLPPRDEQKRIVATVNQLMTLCDDLETKLRRAESGRAVLMSAAVRAVLSATTEPLTLTEHRSL